MAAFHALLNNQRLLFLGHSQPAGGVCTAVLSVPLHVPVGEPCGEQRPWPASLCPPGRLAEAGRARRPWPWELPRASSGTDGHAFSELFWPNSCGRYFAHRCRCWCARR